MQTLTGGSVKSRIAFFECDAFMVIACVRGIARLTPESATAIARVVALVVAVDAVSLAVITNRTDAGFAIPGRGSSLRFPAG
jgi:hypothetical protein